MGREGEETMALILAIRGFLNGSDAATAYLAVAVVTALDPGPRCLVFFILFFLFYLERVLVRTLSTH